MQHICINRPRNRNALDHEAALRLATAVEAFEADSIARVAVLSGSAGTFCAGYDLKAFGKRLSSYLIPLLNKDPDCVALLTAGGQHAP